MQSCRTAHDAPCARAEDVFHPREQTRQLLSYCHGHGCKHVSRRRGDFDCAAERLQGNTRPETEAIGLSHQGRQLAVSTRKVFQAQLRVACAGGTHCNFLHRLTPCPLSICWLIDLRIENSSDFILTIDKSKRQGSGTSDKLQRPSPNPPRYPLRAPMGVMHYAMSCSGQATTNALRPSTAARSRT